MFQFLDPGPLVERELTLVAPDVVHLDELMAACAHPLSRADPRSANYTRQQVIDFLRLAPGGHQPAHTSTYGTIPVYHFWMRLMRPREEPTPAASGGPKWVPRDAGAAADDAPLTKWAASEPPVRIAGTVSLRVGTNRDLELYYGHLGYNVFPPARGNRYAERACRLILPLARAHGMRTLWITTNPDNIPSRRTCERLGARLVEIVPIPPTHALYLRGEREKCRYRLEL